MDKPAYQTSTAAPSLEGYIYQLLQGLLCLVTSDNDAKVGLEIFDDVSIDEKGEVTQVQVKHSQDPDTSALTNLSANVWKTFTIWLSYVKDKDPTCTNTNFFLVTNTEIKESSFLFPFKEGSSAEKIDAAIKKIKDLTTNSETIRGYIEECLSQKNISIFKKILSRLNLRDRSNSNENILTEISNKLPIPTRIDKVEFNNQIMGWYMRQIVNAFGTGTSSWITKEDLNNAISSTIVGIIKPGTIGHKELDIEIEESFITQAMGNNFINHLRLIEITKPNDLQAAAHDYLRFSRAKDKCIANGEVMPTEWAKDEKRFIENWQQICQFTILKASFDETDVKLGQKIYMESLRTNFPPLSGSTREGYIINGQYHELANKDAVWWHPKYPTLKE